MTLLPTPVPRHEPTIVLHAWGGGRIEYWWSAFPPIGVPQRTWHEPIEDEL